MTLLTHNALRQKPHNKAPDPDGFSGKFLNSNSQDKSFTSQVNYLFS